MIIFLQPNVRLTSNQAVFLSLSIVLRSIKKMINLDIRGPLISKGPPISASQGPIRGPWRPMRAPWALVKYNIDHKRVWWSSKGKECFFRKRKHSLAESRKSQGPFKGPYKAHWRTVTGHITCWGQLLCPHPLPSPLSTANVMKLLSFDVFLHIGHWYCPNFIAKLGPNSSSAGLS